MKTKANVELKNQYYKMKYTSRSKTPLTLNSIDKLQKFKRIAPNHRKRLPSTSQVPLKVPSKVPSSCKKIKTNFLLNLLPSLSPGLFDEKVKRCMPKNSSTNGNYCLEKQEDISSSFSTHISTSTSRINSPMKIFSHKRYSCRTQEENDEIRYRLGRFIQTSHKRNEEKIDYAVTHRELSQRFSNLASKINSLLEIKQKIQEVNIGIDERVKLTAGSVNYFRIFSKDQPIPCKFHFELSKGIKQTYVCFSQKNKWPDAENCDKQVQLLARNTFTSFTGMLEQTRAFKEEYIYLSIQAQQEVSLIFQCVFGKANFHKIATPDKGQLEDLAAECPLSLEEILAMCQKSYKPLAQRKAKRVLLTTLIESRQKPVHSLSIINSNEHHQEVISRRDLNERRELHNKFMIIHRNRINKKYEILLQSKQFQLNLCKERINTWISHLKLNKISKLINYKYSELKRQKIEKEKRHSALLKVYIKFKYHLAKIGNSLEKRSRTRLCEGGIIAYNMLFPVVSERAQNALFSFLKANINVNKIKHKCFKYISKIKKIQNLWRRNVKLDQSRKLFLLKLFQQTLNLYIQNNKGKTRKQQIILRKLHIFPQELIAKSVDEYYKNLKKKHLLEILKWRERKKAKNPKNLVHRITDVSLVKNSKPSIIRTKLSQQFSKGSLLKREEHPPIFMYKPSSEVLFSLIEQLMEKPT